MKMPRSRAIILTVILSCAVALPAQAQSRGLKAIRAGDMRADLEFLAALEFEGRSAPSTALNIAARYIALEAGRRGLKPLLPDGSYLQFVPVEVKTLSAGKSHLKVITAKSEEAFFFPESFSPASRSQAEEGAVARPLVFLGTALNLATSEWTKLTLPDLRGKIAVIIDVPPTASAGQTAAVARTTTFARSRFLREKGAVGLVTIIRAEREANLTEKGIGFDLTMSQRWRFPDTETGIPGAASAPSPNQTGSPPSLPFYLVDVRHDAGAAILGLGRSDLDRLFGSAAAGEPVPPKSLDGRTLEIALYYETQRTATPNVVGWIEGTDPKLKGEYIVIGSHHDHLPPREGRVLPGADDNGSGTVAMLALVKAVKAQRPKRSVIFVWHTAEEKGLIGAYYFVQHCPVPVEKISVNLNLDMISRNDPNMIYLIGSNKISSELDRAIHSANDRSSRFKLDYTYESPTHPDRFFFRSDQYPYIRYGIPGVWFFSGTTPDYHQETDLQGKCDFNKMEKAARLTYVTLMDIGSKPALLKLDVNPEITTRGAHNMKINWRDSTQPQTGERR